MKTVKVQWVDSQTSKENFGWQLKEDFERWCQEPLVICESVGFLTFENDEFIVITQTTFGGDMSDSSKIPRSAIKEMVFLENGKPPK